MAHGCIDLPGVGGQLCVIKCLINTVNLTWSFMAHGCIDLPGVGGQLCVIKCLINTVNLT